MSRQERIGPSGTPLVAAPTPTWTSPELDQQIIDVFVAHDGALGTVSFDGISESSIRERARVLGLTKVFTKNCRRGGSRAAVRVCIKCDERFLSSGIHNRLCTRCRPR